MNEKKVLKKARIRDPYVDRRSGEDRRQVYDTDYFESGGIERRKGNDRRKKGERRENCVRVSDWSSVCPEDSK